MLETQIRELRKKIQTHPDAGLHALRRRFPTEAGARTDLFALQCVAGHDTIKPLIHRPQSQANAVQALLMRLGELESRRRRREAQGADWSGCTGTGPQPRRLSTNRKPSSFHVRKW